jgi:hypothetical protein
VETATTKGRVAAAAPLCTGTQLRSCSLRPGWQAAGRLLKWHSACIVLKSLCLRDEWRGGGGQVAFSFVAECAKFVCGRVMLAAA